MTVRELISELSALDENRKDLDVLIFVTQDCYEADRLEVLSVDDSIEEQVEINCG